MKRRYKYLYRLIAIAVLMLSIPTCLFFSYLVQKAFDEVKKGNHAYYEKITDSFISQFNRDVSEMQEHTARLAAASRTAGGALYLGAQEFERNEYWYYEVIQDFADKNYDFDIGQCYLYYYDLDSVISTTSRMSSKQFFNDHLNLKDSTMLASFFAEANYQEGSIQLGRYVGKSAQEGVLLIGFCSQFGKNQEKVLVFYKLTASDVMELMGGGYEDGVNFYILSSTTDELLMAFEENSDRDERIPISGNALRNELGDSMAFEKQGSDFLFTYITAISDDSRQTSVELFYINMRGMVLLLVLTMSALCLIALYLEYKPIYRMMSEIEMDGDGEFAIIRNTLEERREKIDEQKLIIEDLLVSHFLCGTQIPIYKLEKLGVNVQAPFYCVYILENKVLMTGESNRLCQCIENKHLADLYIADLQVQNADHCVIVAFITSNAEETEAALTHWLQENLGSAHMLRIGKTVSRLDDITVSFRSCMQQKNPEELQPDIQTLQDADEKQAQLAELVQAYLDIHYKDPNLSRVQVADDLHISSYALNKVFKAYFGMGFSEYVNAKRLACAKELLLTTDLSAQDIAAAVGFENKNYFYRLFKATNGMSVTEFRKQ